MSTPKRAPFNSSRSRIIVTALLTALMLTAFVPALHAISGAPQDQWSRTYEGVEGHFVVQTTDGGYAIAGTSFTSATLLKTDAVGETLWEKTYGSEVFGGDNNAVSVVQTKNSSYVLFGEGGYLVQTDPEGNVTWSRALGFKGVRLGIQASDGGYVLAGNMPSTNGDNVAWLLKTDEYGNMLWNRTFVGAFYPHALVETYDAGYALAGSRENDFWFLKTDSEGNILWNQNYSYGGTADSHSVYSIVKTQDGGYALAGKGDWQASSGTVPWLLKTDSQGIVQWNQPYDNLPTVGFVSAVQTSEGGYIAVEDYYAVMVKVNASGTIQWQATYGGAGSAVYHYPSWMIQTEDEGYAIVGVNTADTTWLIKTSPEPDVWAPVVSVWSPEQDMHAMGDVPLTFTVSEPASWVGYSLDGQANVTIAGNTTLAGIVSGLHNVTVYASDSAGNIGASETISFSVTESFPIGWIAAVIVVAAVVGLVLLVYFKRPSLKAIKNKGFKKSLTAIKKDGFARSLTAFMSKGVVLSLTIIGLCIVLVLFQLFFPYLYFSSASRSSNSAFEVGVTYAYEEDNVGQIYDEVAHIQALGFKVIRVNLVCTATGVNDYPNGLTDVFFAAAQRFGMRVALAIQNHDDLGKIQYYLNRWGRYLSFIQVLNEPELSSSWDAGALFTDDEIVSNFQEVYAVVEPYRASVQFYTNFGPGFLVRSNVPIQLSKNLDFVGFDVYMESFLVLSPNLVQLLHQMTNKDVVITEFGMSTSDDTAQSNFIIQGLNLFKSMGLKGCWIAYWNSVDNNYGIRGRLAEKTVSEWIGQNANTS